jgi:cell division initiation protein
MTRQAICQKKSPTETHLWGKILLISGFFTRQTSKPQESYEMETVTASGQLTPVEIKNKEFKKTVFGYSPFEVILFLDQTAKTWEKVQQNEKKMTSEITQLKTETDVLKSKMKEHEIIRAAALEEAEKIRQAATDHGRKLLEESRAKADTIQARTQEWLAALILKLQSIEKKRHEMTEELRSRLGDYNALLDDGSQQAAPLEDELKQFLSHQATA